MAQTTDQLVTKLRAISSSLLANTLLLQADRLRRLSAKAGFRPDQAREPAGSPRGGQWVDEGRITDEPFLWLINDDPNKLPDVPEKQPATTKERNAWGVRVARFLLANPTARQARLVAWLVEYADHRIQAYLDLPKTLEELRRNALSARPGYDIHHIVEQTPARDDGYPESRIESPDNKVSIPTYRHWEINAWYQKPNNQFGGLSPREYLHGRSWAERYSVGIRALELHGVLR